MRIAALVTLIAGSWVLAPLTHAAEPAADPASEWARYTPEGDLIKPENYREWVTIGTGLNMVYGPARDSAGSAPPFTNVFVSPAAYRGFLANGSWPDKTVFVLEIRASVPVNAVKNGNNGYFQGELLGIEAEVKDERRFPGKWGFFSVGNSSAGKLIPATASCYSCHAKNAAADNTFVQFYPVLRDVAKEKGTLKAVAESF